MPNRKSVVAKAADTVAPTPRRSKSKRSKSRRSSSPITSTVARAARGVAAPNEWSRYAAPGAAAALVSGAVAAAGYLFRDQLGEVLAESLATATKKGSQMVDRTREQTMDVVEKATDALSLDSILRQVGLQRRSTLMTIVGPAVGAACGFALGSALTFVFAPKVLAAVTEAHAHLTGKDVDVAAESTGPGTPGADASRPEAQGDARANGGLHVS